MTRDATIRGNRQEPRAYPDGFSYDDGGRAAAGFRGSTGDCACRAVAIASGKPYAEIYARINEIAKSERRGKRKRKISHARTGVYRPTMHKLLTELGFEWTPCMGIGTGCKVHLDAAELPSGRLVLSLSRHFTVMIDGIIHDTYDPRRETHWVRQDHGGELKPGEWRNENGICSIARRCVYGYWKLKGSV